MLTVLISSLIAGAAVGLFARLLALAISTVVFGTLITVAGALTHAWSGLEIAGVFAAAVVVFQIGSLIGLGVRQLLPQTQGRPAAQAHGRSRPWWRRPA